MAEDYKLTKAQQNLGSALLISTVNWISCLIIFLFENLTIHPLSHVNTLVLFNHTNYSKEKKLILRYEICWDATVI